MLPAASHKAIETLNKNPKGFFLMVEGGEISVKAHKVLLIFPTNSHTAVMVPVFAYGPGAEKFSGIYDNTAFFQKFLTSYGFDEVK